jgi:CRP-like cAMP-binding protein
MFDLIKSNFARHINLSPAETDFTLSLFTHRVVKKRTALLSAGNVCREVYFVNKGCLRLYQIDTEGIDHVISFMPENWWAVDIESFYNHSPAVYCIDALEDTEVLILSYENQALLYEHVPKFERFFRILTQNGFILYQKRIMQNLSKTAEERYRLFRKRYPNLEHRIAQKDIAAYLGITPVFVSVLRKRL